MASTVVNRNYNVGDGQYGQQNETNHGITENMEPENYGKF